MNPPPPPDSRALLEAEALQERDRFFALSLELFCVAGFDGYFKQLNPSWEAVLGHTVAELIARPYIEFIHPEDRESTRAAAGKLEEGRDVIVFENRYRCRDGSYRWLQWSAHSDMERRLIYAVARDVTGVKLALAGGARYADLVGSSDDAILSKTLEGVITSWNPGAQRLFGYAADEILGKPMPAFFPPDRAGEEAEILARIRRGERLKHYETMRMHRDGSMVPVSASISPILDSAGRITGASTILRDSTDRLRLEREALLQTEELARSNAELQAFSYSVSHDLRAPLRGIDGWSLALLEDFGDKLDPKGREYLGRVRTETQRMGQLIEDLLHLSRLSQSEMHPGPVDLSAIAGTIAARLRESEPDREVEFIIQPGIIARGDAGLLHAALTNLLENAWKFTGKQPAARIEFGRMEAAGAPCYFVRDNGAGFDMVFATKLFGPFQRMHKVSEFPGTGIGLATVQRIVHRHAGRVWAESEVGRGATFYFTLEEAS